MKEILNNAVYTPQETQELLKISSSTFKRMIKKRLIRANKVGGQYRIVGHELLRLVSPDFDTKVTHVYQQVKQSTKQKTKHWD